MNRRWHELLALVWAAIATGCSPSSKMAGPPTAEQIRAFEAEQKQVEEEERGTPVGDRRAKGPVTADRDLPRDQAQPRGYQ
jgi:hypothetical protein